MKGNRDMELKKKIMKREAKIAVIGLGYVGLPLLVEFAKAGFDCFGIEVDRKRIGELKKAKSYLEDLPSETIKKLLYEKRLHFFANYSVLAKVDVAIICVPTPLSKTKDPDFSYVLSAVQSVADYLKQGQLVVVESTIYPGMTLEVFKPILEEKKGYKEGKDFYLAFSPERIDPGNKQYSIRNTPKVVGGVSRVAGLLTEALYSQIIEKVVLVSSSTVAEMTKLLENTFRAINIGLVNEIAIICDKLNIDVWEVINSASTKPFGFMTFYPGPGLGGHCIPVDPLYLSWKMRMLNYKARFIELATEINSEMPEFWVTKIQDLMNQNYKSLKGAKVLVMGVAYKGGVSDTRESPSLEIIRLLLSKGAKVYYSDPFVPHIEIEGKRMSSISLSPSTIKSFDCVVIATDHPQFDYLMIKRYARLVVDTRNALNRFAKIEAEI